MVLKSSSHTESNYTVVTGWLYKINMSTLQERNIEELESDIERQRLEIFELKGEIKILRQMLKDATSEIQKNQGYYDDDGNYVE